MFWNLLRDNTVNICYIETFVVLLKKIKYWWCFILISSYEAVKHQKLPVNVTKGLSFDVPKHTTASISDS